MLRNLHKHCKTGSRISHAEQSITQVEEVDRKRFSRAVSGRFSSLFLLRACCARAVDTPFRLGVVNDLHLQGHGLADSRPQATTYRAPGSGLSPHPHSRPPCSSIRASLMLPKPQALCPLDSHSTSLPLGPQSTPSPIINCHLIIHISPNNT